MVRQIDDLGHLKSIGCVETFDDIHAALSTAIASFHRIKYDPTVGVKAHPVVRKDRVRRVRLRSVFDDDCFYAVSTKIGHQVVKLRHRGLLLLVRRRIGFALEAIGRRRLRIAFEARRSNHQHA